MKPAVSTAYIAATAAAMMIAVQVSSKATRDALFLSSFGIEQLPAMLLGASAFSFVSLLWASRAMARWTPERLIPLLFLSSAGLLAVEWAIMVQFQAVAAVLLYLHVAAFGSFLVSGFWSIINERFDPQTAKRKISLIAGGGALGGLLGGLAGERVGAMAPLSAMLPLMAGMHLVCCVLVFKMRYGDGASSVPPGASSGPLRPRLKLVERDAGSQGPGQVYRTPYLRHLALLVLTTTAGATLLDYVFKARAVEVYTEGPSLMRYFAVFYAAIGLFTFLLQSVLGRPTLERLGPAGTITLLPATIAMGGFAMLFVPGLGLASAVRGGEASLRSSLFRSGYELLYTPVSPDQKRAAKSIIDVGVDRIADGAGALLIRVCLWVIPAAALSALLAVAMVLAGVAMLVARKLQHGYVNALESRMVRRAEELEVPRARNAAPGSSTHSLVMQTLGNLELGRFRHRRQRQQLRPPLKMAHLTRPAGDDDPVIQTLADLQSPSVAQVRERLKSGIDLEAAGQAIRLLARDEVAEDAVEALGRIAGRIAGELTDRLIDPETDFAVRRRIPRVLAVSDSPRAIAGLLDGLGDARFEVRFQCAVALEKIRDRRDAMAVPADRLEAAVVAELDENEPAGLDLRLVDIDHVGQPDPLLADHASLSLQHVFRLLSLRYEREPLQIALQGLYTDDPQLRGTSMEYLESVLPPEILERLSPLLEHAPAGEKVEPTGTDPRALLLESRDSIQVKLRDLHRKE